MKPSKLTAVPVNQSAVSIIPPEEVWEEIQFDKSYMRWDPHINLLWPFLPSGYFNQAVEVLQSNGQFQKVPPFRIRLERFGFSPNSKYLHLQVSLVGVPQPVVTKGSKKKGVQPQETPLEVLHKVLSQAFPSCVPSGIQPNITNTKKVTRGQIPQEEIQAKCDEFQANWVPIEFDVTHIHFLSRKTDSEKMKILQSLPLLGK